MKIIPFHRPYITDNEITEVTDSLRSGWLTMGPKTLRFEEEFGRYIGSRHSIAVSSCTAALHLALKVVDLRPDDEVILPTMTFTATGEVVCYFNARPVLVDVERNTHNLDVSKIERAINYKTRVIIPVHYGGQPCDMDEIMKLAKKYNLYVIEDAAHSLPAWYKSKVRSQESGVRSQESDENETWKKIGTIGDMTCFSFYATKPLTTGEGGMITTDHHDWAERMAALRLHGINSNAWKRHFHEGSWYYEVTEAGYKYNMTDIQAALGVSQLKKLEWMWERRRQIAEMYTKVFRDNNLIIPPYIKPDCVSAWHLYVIKINVEALSIGRTEFTEELKKRGIGTSVHFIPLHRHPFYRNTFGYETTDFTEAEWIYERIISLPIYPAMTDEDVARVIEEVMEVANRAKR